MRVQKHSGDELNRLLTISNETAKAFKQPLLYIESAPSAMDLDLHQPGQPTLTGKEAWSKTSFTNSHFQERLPSDKEPDMSSSFHISIGWTLEAPSQDMIEEKTMCVQIFVDTVKVKIGNIITTIPLSSQVKVSGGIIGI